LSFAVEDESEADDVLEARRVEQQGADGVQRVEPAARLVNRFADVIGWELGLEHLLIFERIVPLCHRIEPESNQQSISSGTRRIELCVCAYRAIERDCIHVRPVRVHWPGQRLPDASTRERRSSKPPMHSL